MGLILCDCYVIKFPKFMLRQTRLRTNYRIFYLEFEAIEWATGLNSFALTPQRWVEQMHAKGFVAE